MNKKLLEELSNADAIAGNEQEVRDIVLRESEGLCDEVLFDGLGSTILHRRGRDGSSLKIMFCAHMDEVGFAVRSISDIGFLYLMPVGGVRENSQDMQMVRVTTADGTKVRGILNTIRDSSNHVAERYVDIGTETRDETLARGIQIGDMVTFDSTCRFLSDAVAAGKAMDDRTGIFAMLEAMRRLERTECDLYFAATSSEEVGTRGGRTASELIQPDIVFAIDVANAPELTRDFTNCRKIGHGLMIEHYDKTLAPNRSLVMHVRSLCAGNSIPWQDDMMKGGGTDAGSAALAGSGRLAMVLGIPLRYCHGPGSLAHLSDLEAMTDLIIAIAENTGIREYSQWTNYRGK